MAQRDGLAGKERKLQAPVKEKMEKYAQARRRNRRIACKNAGAALKTRIQELLEDQKN